MLLSGNTPVKQKLKVQQPLLLLQ